MTEPLTTPASVIDLRGLLHGEEADVVRCIDAMRKRGWILVRLTDDLKSGAATAGADLQAFFEKNDPMKIEKNPGLKLGSRNTGDELWRLHVSHPLLGYEAVGSDRQALRILTGGELSSQKLPPSCEKEVKDLGEVVDAALRKATEKISVPLFGMSIAELAEVKPEMPFFCDNTDGSNYALMEAAFYHNRGEGGEVCAPHHDPGLLSLNVLSAEPGLQFKCESEEWHDVDDPSWSLGVLWTGAAAADISKKTVAPAIHRVVLPNKSHKPRLSIWSEICTKDQIFVSNDVLGEGVTVQGDKICIPNVYGGKGKPYIVSIQKGSVLETLKLVSMVKGLPMSKVMRRPVYNDEGEVIDVK